MLQHEITDRVLSDKERRDMKEDMNKPNKRKALEDRRKVEHRRSNEERIEQRRIAKEEGYE